MLQQTVTNPRAPKRRFQSRNPDEVVDYVGEVLAPHRMDTRYPTEMAAQLACFDLAPVKIVDIQYGTEVWVDPGELEACYLVHAALQGETTMRTGTDDTMIRPDNLYVSSPGKAFKCRMSPECRHLTVRIQASALEGYLSRVLNIAITRPLIFYAGQEGGRELPTVWRNMIAHIVRLVDDAPVLMGNAQTQKQYSMVLIDMLLSNYCNSYSEQIALYGNDISPRHVRQARDIIHASLDETISVTDIAEQVGVSVRSLQIGFRQFIGLTPFEYVRRHRLEKLHRALMDNGGGQSVTELMLECGIINFGRYAQYYRQQYGCRPSDTLRNRRLT